MNSTALPETIQQTAEALDASARDHKRAERFHRQAAQRDRQALDRLLEFAWTAGVRVRVNGVEVTRG
jgi:hypothetical protein